MSNDSSVEQKLISPWQFLLLLSPPSAPQLVPGSLGLCHKVPLSSLSNYLQRGLSAPLIATSVCVFPVETPDRFESPDILEPDCWAKTNWCPVSQPKNVERHRLTQLSILKRTADPSNWTFIRDRISRMNAGLQLVLVSSVTLLHTSHTLKFGAGSICFVYAPN